MVQFVNPLTDINELIKQDHSKIEIDYLHLEDFEKPIHKMHTLCTSVYLHDGTPIMVTKTGKNHTNTKVFFNLLDAKHVLDESFS